MLHYIKGFARAVKSGSRGRGVAGVVDKVVGIYQDEGVNGITRRLSLYARHSVRRKTNRPRLGRDYALAVPFKHPVQRPAGLRVCAIIHVYYVDLAAEILRYLNNVPGELDLYISTVSETAAEQVRVAFGSYEKGRVEVRVFENRGRDIAAKLVGFADVYANYDLALSLHTKKSPHGGHALEGWRTYLYENLLGSPAVVASIFTLLSEKDIGMAFPQHFFYLQKLLSWGDSFDDLYMLLQRMGIQMDHRTVLELPSGSMFWCRTDALRPLLDLKLTFADFPQEKSQIDGTLAHAVERAFLFAVEKRGYRWAKIVQPGMYPLSSTILPVNSPEEMRAGIKRVFRPLLHARSHLRMH